MIGTSSPRPEATGPAPGSVFGCLVELRPQLVGLCERAPAGPPTAADPRPACVTAVGPLALAHARRTRRARQSHNATPPQRLLAATKPGAFSLGLSAWGKGRVDYPVRWSTVPAPRWSASPPLADLQPGSEPPKQADSDRQPSGWGTGPSPSIKRLARPPPGS
jgi:hypothetical protein